MAYQMPFVAYQPHPSGNGYLLQHQNGNTYYSYGPGADMIKAQIDASTPPDQRLAMNDAQAIQQATQDVMAAPQPAQPQQVNPGGSLTMHIAPQDANPLAQYASNVDPRDLIKAQQGQAKDRAPVMNMQDLSPDLQAAAQHPVAVPAGASETSQPVNRTNEPPGKVVPPSGQLPMMRGGTQPRAAEAQHPGMMISPVKYVPGRNPAAEAKNAVAVPTAQSVVTEGGIQDPEARKAAVEAYHAQVDAQKNLAKVQEDSATAQLEQQRADLLEAQQRQGAAESEIAKQQARQSVLRQEFDNRMAIAQKDYDVASSKEVDQYRVFKGSTGATLAGILSAVAAGFGAVGASISHNPNNYALQTMNRIMDNDIEAQRAQIQQGVAKSSNDLKRIADQYNVDYDDAAQILKLNYARSLDAQAAKKAALAGTLQAKQAYAAVQPTFQKWMADAQANLQASLDGKVKMVQEAKMVTPSRGGFVPKTDEEITKEYERGARRAVAESTMEHGGQKPGAQAPEKAAGEVTPNLSRALVATETALRSVDELIAKNESRGYAGTAANKLAGAVTDTEWSTLVNHGAQPIASAEANGMAADPHRTNELESALNSGNYNTVKNHLNSLRDQLSKKRESILGVSAKTARVGQVGGGGGEGGGAEQ